MTDRHHPLSLLALLGCLWLGGCALPGLQHNGATQAQAEPDELEVMAERYQALQKKLRKLAADAPERATLERQAASYLAEFEELALNRARGHERNHELLAAVQVLNGALERLPSKRLQNLRDELNSRRLRELQALAWQEEIADTRHLMEISDILSMRAQLAELTAKERKTLARADQQLELAAQALKGCAREALDAGRPAIAAKCADLAGALAGESYIAEERARIRARLAEKPAPKARKAPKELPGGRREVRQLRLRLHLQVRQGALLEARETLRRLIGIEGETPQFRELKTAIDNAITARVEELAERANRFYREQEYTRARDAWRELLRYDPDNSEARAALERAEKILHKLEELKQQQGESRSTGPDTHPSSEGQGARDNSDTR